MQELNMMEVEFVSGGTECKKEESASLKKPISDPQSEFGKMVNDVAGALDSLGTYIGGKLYDWLN